MSNSSLNQALELILMYISSTLLLDKISIFFWSQWIVISIFYIAFYFKLKSAYDMHVSPQQKLLLNCIKMWNYLINDLPIILYNVEIVLPNRYRLSIGYDFLFEKKN